mmetsp:Transcript_34326/g.74487  ORF Transcript_34326/g.74487 Transcript_34326/m.74487 type:complete len:81 (-) Transcript_34326:559-801(-)
MVYNMILSYDIMRFPVRTDQLSTTSCSSSSPTDRAPAAAEEPRRPKRKRTVRWDLSERPRGALMPKKARSSELTSVEWEI